MESYCKTFAKYYQSRDEEGFADILLFKGNTKFNPNGAASMCMRLGLEENASYLCEKHLMADMLMIKGDFAGSFSCQIEAFEKFVDEYRNEGGWLIPTLKTLITDTLRLAKTLEKKDTTTNGAALKEAKRVFESCHRYTLMGRATTLDAHKKRSAALYIVNSLFRVFFALKSVQLCRNIIKSVNMPTFPEMDSFPIAQRVTYHYFLGRILVLEDDIAGAKEAFDFALKHCHKYIKPKNIKILYEFLVPINLFFGISPAPGLLEKHQITYLEGFVSSVKNGNVAKFESMLEQYQDLLFARGLYLSMQNLKVVAYRNLFKAVIFLHQNSVDEKMKTRVSLDLFVRPFQLYGEKSVLELVGLKSLDSPDALPLVKEQTRCILSNLIFRNYIKGYISHEREILVISPKEPFPPLKSVSL